MGGGIYDPSVLFDLDEIMMGGGDSNELHTSLIHTPIKEEPEYDHDDNRYNMVAKHQITNVCAIFMLTREFIIFIQVCPLADWIADT